MYRNSSSEKVKMNRSLLDALANECLDAKLGHTSYETAVKRMHAVLTEEETCHVVRKSNGNSFLWCSY